MEIKPYDALWIVGGVFMSFSGLFNLMTAVMNFFWKCIGKPPADALFGWEMDVVYGKLFFTYPCVAFSKIEGLCTLLLCIGCFMAWAEDVMIQFIAFVLQELGCAYWIICIFYAGMIKDLQLALMGVPLVAISLGCAFTRGPGYIFRENEDLETPFWIISGVILGMALMISLAAVFTMNDEKQALIDRMWQIKKYCTANPEYKWSIDKASTPGDAPEGFEGNADTENTGMKNEAGRTDDAAVTEDAATENAATEDAPATEEAGKDTESV